MAFPAGRGGGNQATSVIPSEREGSRFVPHPMQDPSSRWSFGMTKKDRASFGMTNHRHSEADFAILNEATLSS